MASSTRRPGPKRSSDILAFQTATAQNVSRLMPSPRDQQPLRSLAGVHSVVLLEFIDVDRFPGQIAVHFPVLAGHCRNRGIDVRWIRYGIATDNFRTFGADAITLSSSELAYLRNVVEQVRPDLVISTHELSTAAVESIATAHAAAAVVLFDDLVRAELSQATPASFRVQAELDREGLVPDYRWEPANPAASRLDRHNIYILLKAHCGYRRSVHNNPAYHGIAFEPGTRTLGCAFCGISPENALCDTDASTPRRWLDKQLSAIRIGLADRPPNALLFESLEEARLLPYLVDRLTSLGMHGVKILFALRVDRLLALRDSLLQVLPDLARSGHAIHVYTVGLESFSDEELLRLNKGIRSEQAVRAVNLLQHLEATFPGAFHYAGYMPLGMILFTPWTTFADLDQNLGIIEHLAIQNETGNAFLARLRLHPDLAITALAKRDGLVVDHLDDDGLLLNRRKLFPRELPWRFRDPRMDLVNSLAVRLDESGAFDGDPLDRAIEARKGQRSASSPWDQAARIALLRCIAAAAAESQQPLGPDQLLDRAFSLFDTKRMAHRNRQSPRETFRLGVDSVTLPVLVDRLSPLIRSGQKRLVSIERVSRKALSQLDRNKLQAAQIHFGFHPDPALPDGGALFLAASPEPLDRLAGLYGAIASPDPTRAKDAIAALGELFGYPRCCRTAWANDPWPDGSSLPWALVARRAAFSGRLEPDFSPLLAPDLAFVPCSAGCDHAAETLRGWHRTLQASTGDAPSGRRIALFSLEGDDDFATVAAADTEAGYRYAPDSVLGTGLIATALRRANQIEVRAGQLILHDEQAVTQRWTASVALWDTAHQRFPSVWTELAVAARNHADPKLTAARKTAYEAFRTSLADPVTTTQAAAASAVQHDRDAMRHPQPSLASARHVNWTEISLTPRCNQRCFFCYEDARDTAKEPSLEEVRALLQETRKHADQVVLCGREVLLRKDVLDIVSYAHSLGLQTVVFTNGQALAREGMVERLVAAGCSGIAISFHFPDADTFARGARVSPKAFERVLAGLRNLRDYALAHPDVPLGISTETDLFALNAGRLREMRDTLMTVLGGSPWRMRLASLLPTRVHDIGVPRLLEDFESRQAELERFVRTQPPELPLGFVKLPLCLLPSGEEHRCLDVQYVHEGTRLTFNHLASDTIAVDTFSSSEARDSMALLRKHPYRWVCRPCALAPLCRFERVSWSDKGFEPSRSQRPIPYRAADSVPAAVDKLPIPTRTASASDVLNRLGPAGGSGRHVDQVRRLLDRTAFPEESILLQLSTPEPGSPEPGAPHLHLEDAYVGASPFLVVLLAANGQPVRLHLAPPANGSPPFALVGYLAVRPLDDLPLSDPLLHACLRRLAAVSLPAIREWDGDTWFDAPAARLAQAAWSLFHEDLWPGRELAPSWFATSTTVVRDALALQLNSSADCPATLLFRLPSSAPHTPVVDVTFDQASPAAPDSQAILLQTIAAILGSPTVPPPPPPGSTLRWRAGAWTADASTPAASASPSGLHVRARHDGDSFDFHIGPSDPERPAYERVGPRSVWYAQASESRLFYTCARIVVAAMKHLHQTPLSEAAAPTWTAALRKLSGRANLPQIVWEVGLVEHPSPPQS